MKLFHYIAILCLLVHVSAKAQNVKKEQLRRTTATPKNKYGLLRHITYSSTFSASYVSYHNWKYSGYNNFTFLTRQSVNYDTIGTNWEHHIRFNGELGFMKFIDSTWYKSSDYLDLSFEMIRSDRKNFSKIFTAYTGTQFLSDYEIVYNDSGVAQNKWKAGFANPLFLDLGYGVDWTFWKTCRINLTYITLRTNTTPIYQVYDLDTNAAMIYKKSVITSEYGLGIQTFIRHDFTDRIRWENYSRFFGNAVHREKIDINFRNRIVIKALKNLHLIFDSRIMYKPVAPYKFQFRNELMLSFVLEKY